MRVVHGFGYEGGRGMKWMEEGNGGKYVEKKVRNKLEGVLQRYNE
jgi:hypothetical protein